MTLRSGGSNLVNFTGTINVKSGVLSMDNLNGTLTGNPDLNVESGGLFGIRGQDVSVNALTGDGDVFNNYSADSAGHILTVGANNGSGTFSGVIHGNNSTNDTDLTIEAGRLHLTKTGTGTQTLTGANTYSGQTTVSVGTLLLGASGSITNSSTIDVKSGATFDVLATGGFTVGASQTLKGSGTINGATAISGILAPGDSVGTLTTNDMTFQPGSSFAFEIADWNGTTSGTDWDLLAADTLIFNNTPASKLTLVISGPDANFGEANRTFPIATAATSITGFDPAAVAIDATAFPGSGTWAVQQNGLAIELVYTAGAGNAFNAWAAANAPGQTIDMDHDNDGVPNGIEYFMGESGSGFTAMPALDASRTISWTKDPVYPGAYDTHYVIETSTNLIDWEPLPVEMVTIGTTVAYTIPTGVPARFARLKVTGP